MAITKIDLTKGITGTLPRANGGSDMVLLSTTTPTAVRDIDISIASGYDNYLIIGRGLDISSGGGETDLYFTSDNFSTTDTAVRSQRVYNRLDTSQVSGGAVFSGYCNIATNQGVEATDNLDFEFILFGATISSRSLGYSFNGHSIYGHDGDTHHYRYEYGGRSQTTSVIDGIRLRTNSDKTYLATGSVKIYGLK